MIIEIAKLSNTGLLQYHDRLHYAWQFHRHTAAGGGEAFGRNIIQEHFETVEEMRRRKIEHETTGSELDRHAFCGK